MSEAVELVRAYVEAAQAARSSASPEDWDLVRSYRRGDVLTPRAGDGTGPEWIIVSERRWTASLSRPAANAARLQTATVDVFGAGGKVVVEQVSTYQRLDGSVARKPVCFVSFVTSGRTKSSALGLLIHRVEGPSSGSVARCGASRSRTTLLFDGHAEE